MRVGLSMKLVDQNSGNVQITQLPLTPLSSLNDASTTLIAHASHLDHIHHHGVCSQLLRSSAVVVACAQATAAMLYAHCRSILACSLLLLLLLLLNTGQDLDPTNEEAGEEASRRKGSAGGLQAPLELGAVFNTQCSKCGAKGHMSVDCFSRVSNVVHCHPTVPRVVAIVLMWYIALLSSSDSYSALAVVVALQAVNCYHQHNAAYEQCNCENAVLCVRHVSELSQCCCIQYRYQLTNSSDCCCH
jgi:hypothetical protein